MTMQLTHGALPASHDGDRQRDQRASAYLRAAALDQIARRVRAFVTACAAERQHRKAVHALQMLDNRTLADIGLPRSGIPFAAREAARAERS